MADFYTRNEISFGFYYRASGLYDDLSPGFYSDFMTYTTTRIGWLYD